jgi:hypothetical protein
MSEHEIILSVMLVYGIGILILFRWIMQNGDYD